MGSNPTRRIPQAPAVTRPTGDVEVVLDLAADSRNPSEIERETGIPRSTIRRWLDGSVPTGDRHGGRSACIRCSARHRSPLAGVTEHAYAYLLGLYLGDGWITLHRGQVFRLLILLDASYTRIIRECEAAMSLVMPVNRVASRRRPGERAVEVSAYSRHWPCLFPQHGPGRKHERTIELESCQRAIADRYPRRLLRGLIHSDGCRGINTIKHREKTYAYPRYAFSNRSGDIRDLFCEYCDRVGVEWRRMNRWNISVARRESVALMDRFIGPKR